MNGDAGNDVIFIRSNAAQTDTMNGGAGTDTIRLDAATVDIVLSGTQRISGIEGFEGGGRAVLGSAGNDVLNFSIFAAVTGVASIQGLNGNDTITGSVAADQIIGGGGNDTLFGGPGDQLTGNAGADRFAFNAGTPAGVCTITDFDGNGNDAIRLLGFGIQASAVQAATSFSAGVATIDLDALGGAGDIRLLGVTALTFGSEDFLFT